jgi:hypothetical protein
MRRRGFLRLVEEEEINLAVKKRERLRKELLNGLR